MTYEQPAVETSPWRELLGPRHLGAAIVLAGGVLVDTINIYLTASLLPTSAVRASTPGT